MSYIDYDDVIDYLYLGNMNSVNTTEIDFSLIVNCSKDLAFPNNAKECIRIAIDDDPAYSDILLEIIKTKNVLDKINNYVKNNKYVLVHCRAGMQRSCALIAIYLIKYYNMKPDAAIEYVKYRRPVAFLGSVNLEGAINDFYYSLKRDK
jgi:protein-tyrosine phosphatase